MEVRIIREEAEEEVDASSQKDTILEQIAQLTNPQNLLTELKSVELSLPIESMTELLKVHHDKFEGKVRSIIKKQQVIMKQVKSLQVDPNIGRMDTETNRVLKKVEDFEDIRQETYKYRMLVDMMKQTLNHIEEDVDKLIDARISELTLQKQKSKESS